MTNNSIKTEEHANVGHHGDHVHDEHFHDEHFHEEKEIFLNYVQKCGLRRTAQRDLILEVFLKTEEHLSSEDLYDLVKREDPTIGHTTVYRTLKLLTEAGLASEVRFGDGRTHYEHQYNHQPHDHMVCTECHKIIEFYSPELEAMRERIALEHNFETTQHSLRISGLCENCHDGNSTIKPKTNSNRQAPLGAPALHHK